MKPSWLNGKLKTQVLQDEAEIIQYGQETEQTFYSFELPAPLPSAWIYFPTDENQSSRYKFASIEINFSLDVKQWQRQTYSLLDWLGDLGGLFDALLYICRMLISPLSVYTLKQTILSNMFRFKSDKVGRPRGDEDDDGNDDDLGETDLPISKKFRATVKLSPKKK